MSHFIALLWFNFVVSISSSLTAPSKCFQQSETISDGRPLRLMNLCIALMKLSVSNDSANSICTTRTDKQTKIQPHLFTLDLFCLAYVGPNKSIPDLKNGGLPCFTLKERKGLMKSSFGLAFLRLHTIHPPPICLADTLLLITQKLCFVADNTYSVPK